MMRLFRWVRANARWVRDGWLFWGAVLVVAFILGASFLLPGGPDDHARYAGLTLQLLGIGTVVHGLRDRRRLFNRPTLWGHIGAWLRRRPHLNPKPQIITASATGSFSVIGKAKLSVWRAASADAPLDARIEMLQANLETLRAEHNETARDFQDELRKATESVNSERDTRESAVGSIRTSLDSLGAGGLHIESAGLFWLITGVVLATVPAELAMLLRFP